MNSTPTQLGLPAKSGLRGTTIALLAAVVLGTVVVVTVAKDFLADPDTVTLLLSSLVFFGLLAFAASYARSGEQQAKWLIFIIWWSLLISEEIFSYRSDISTVAKANFASQAYDQAILWFVALFGLLVVVLKYPQSMRGLFQGDYKWVSWITLVSVLSCAYAPNPAFSLAWAFKLALVVVVVHMCSQQMSSLQDVKSFLNLTLWGFVVLTLAPTLRSIFEADPKGEYGTGPLEQRFREAPTAISGIAGLLAILCLTLYKPGKRRWPLAVGAMGLVIMVVSGGKTGIAAGFFTGFLFYAMQKRFKAAMGFLVVTAVLFALAVKFTPLSVYFENYDQLGQLSSFTGRTDLWAFVVPFILQKPILGQGFNASRFIAVIHPDTPFGSSHMHNSLIEALYNNGLVGLVLIMMVQFVIVKNLWRTIQISATPELRYLGVGCLAAFVNLFINGMCNATFGGRPDAPYMMLIALVIVSIHLLALSKEAAAQEFPARLHTLE